MTAAAGQGDDPLGIYDSPPHFVFVLFPGRSPHAITMSAEEDDLSYEEVEEVYEIDEEGNEWLVTEEYEEVDDDDDTTPGNPSVVTANLGALDRNSRNASNSYPSMDSRFHGNQKDQARGDTSTVFGDTSTVQVSNTSPNTSRNGVGLETSEAVKRLNIGSRFKNLVARPPQASETPTKKGVQQAPAPTAPPVGNEGALQPKKTRHVRRIRKPRGEPGGDAQDQAPDASNHGEDEEDANQPKAVYTLSVVRDETTGREISRTVTGKKPPHYQPQGPNEKRYMTKTYLKTRTNPVNRHKEVEETSVTYEKPRSPIFEQTLPSSALLPTNELNPARKTNQWEQPIWVKNKMEAGSSIRTGANLEKPITTATTSRKNAGALSFTIERA
jgi:hypothetical protein